MWKNIVEGAGHRWQYGACALHAGYLRHTVRICNNDCFSTTTMVARTRLNISYTYSVCFVLVLRQLPDYPYWGFSVLFSLLKGKCQGKTRKDGSRPALFLIFVLFYVLIVLWRSMYCLCVYVCWTTATGWLTQLQLNISYHIKTG
jgi:hypothetical protein